MQEIQSSVKVCITELLGQFLVGYKRISLYYIHVAHGWSQCEIFQQKFSYLQQNTLRRTISLICLMLPLSFFFLKSPLWKISYICRSKESTSCTHFPVSIIDPLGQSCIVSISTHYPFQIQDTYCFIYQYFSTFLGDHFNCRNLTLRP